MIGLKFSMNYDIQSDRPNIFLEHRRDEDLLPTLLERISTKLLFCIISHTTTTPSLIGALQNRIESMMMLMDLRDNDLKPAGNGN